MLLYIGYRRPPPLSASDHYLNCHRHREQAKRRNRCGPIHFPFGSPETERGAESVPQVQSERRRQHSKDQELPLPGAVHEQVSGVSKSLEGSAADVDPIGDEAEPGKEPEQIHSGTPTSGGYEEGKQRQQRADNRTGPNLQQGMGIGGHIRSGNRAGMEHHLFNGAAADQCTQNMAEFMNGLHRQP